MTKTLLSGNEAIARGAYEAGVHVATAYPGTPSTEILENIVKYEGIHAEWSTNEKVAMEVAMGASFGGARALVAMKHVGLNVAADPFFSFAYVGVNGGTIIVSADDPGMHSSQNEQDNRRYAKFAKVPMLEPSDSQEAKDFVGLGLEISEEYNVPVLLRCSTRISHSKCVVELGERTEVPVKEYTKQWKKRVLVPANARVQHCDLEERLKRLEKYVEETPINRMEMANTKVGIVTSGISYQYAKEAFPEYSFLKLGMSFPFPKQLVKEFADKVDELWVVEEGEPCVEEEIKLMGLKLTGKDKLPICGEFNQKLVKDFFTGKGNGSEIEVGDLPPRPPLLCPGCSHRGVSYVLNKLKMVAATDIGCYALGVLPPLNCGDSCICMGASVGNVFGMELARGKEFAKKAVAVIGDSTFLHGGMTGLANIAYNKGISTVIIMDNSTTAMTGHQSHPGTGITLKGEPTVKVDYLALARSFGIKRTVEMDGFNLEEIEKTIKEETSSGEPSLIVNKGECILLQARRKKFKPYKVDSEKCTGCKLCLRVGCPGVSFDVDENCAVINPIFCVGDDCGICKQVCKFDCFVST